MIMARFVPKGKLNKKAQKELNRQRRTMWDFNPVSRTVDSKKRYNRKRIAQHRDDYGLGDFVCGGECQFLFPHNRQSIFFMGDSQV